MSLRSAVVSKHVQGPSAIDFGIIPGLLYARARFRQQRQYWPGWSSFEVFSEATAQGHKDEVLGPGMKHLCYSSWRDLLLSEFHSLICIFCSVFPPLACSPRTLNF